MPGSAPDPDQSCELIRICQTRKMYCIICLKIRERLQVDCLAYKALFVFLYVSCIAIAVIVMIM